MVLEPPPPNREEPCCVFDCPPNSDGWDEPEMNVLNACSAGAFDVFRFFWPNKLFVSPVFPVLPVAPKLQVGLDLAGSAIATAGFPCQGDKRC